MPTSSELQSLAISITQEFGVSFHGFLMHRETLGFYRPRFLFERLEHVFFTCIQVGTSFCRAWSLPFKKTRIPPREQWHHNAKVASLFALRKSFLLFWVGDPCSCFSRQAGRLKRRERSRSSHHEANQMQNRKVTGQT